MTAYTLVRLGSSKVVHVAYGPRRIFSRALCNTAGHSKVPWSFVTPAQMRRSGWRLCRSCLRVASVRRWLRSRRWVCFTTGERPGAVEVTSF